MLYFCYKITKEIVKEYMDLIVNAGENLAKN